MTRRACKIPIFPVISSLLLISAFLSGFCMAQGTEARKIVMKVNLGGGPIGDFLGEDQVLDMTGFSKNIVKAKVENTDHPDVFQSMRFARGKDFTMRIPVPTGLYSVTLLFAETFRPACVPGARVFDIALGTPISGVSRIVDAFDVFQSAGCMSAHGKRFDKVPSKDGIVVHLAQKNQHPSMCGFIVEGYPMPTGDGNEFKAIARDPAMANFVAKPIVATNSNVNVAAAVAASRRRRLVSLDDSDE